METSSLCAWEGEFGTDEYVEDVDERVAESTPPAGGEDAVEARPWECFRLEDFRRRLPTLFVRVCPLRECVEPDRDFFRLEEASLVEEEAPVAFFEFVLALCCWKRGPSPRAASAA